jgi:CTD small phosphatase-like protein 2
MDETLIHCLPNESISDTGSDNSPVTDVVLQIPNYKGDLDQSILRVNIRPYMAEVVKELKKTWQVIIFTASHPHYANTILDYLDPEEKLFEARFYRDSCYTTSDRVHIKDLRIFGREMRDIVIVDNASHSFGF